MRVVRAIVVSGAVFAGMGAASFAAGEPGGGPASAAVTASTEGALNAPSTAAELVRPRAEAETSPAPGSRELAKILQNAADYEAADNYEGALSVLRKAYDAGHTEAEIIIAQAVIELESGDAAKASARLGQARAKAGDTAEILLWSAVAASAGKDEAKAGELFAGGLAAAGSDEVALYDLAEKFLRRGAFSVAAALYRRINDVYPSESQFDIFSWLHLAAYYGFIDRNGDAALVLDQARRPIEYSDVEVMTRAEVEYLVGCFRGKAAIGRGDFEGGVNILRYAAVRLPDGIAADGEIVKALAAAGKNDEADGAYAISERYFRDKVAAAPESGEAYANLAMLRAVSGRDLDKGLKSCDWALRMSPLRPEYLNTRAALLGGLGRYDEALVDVERAIAIISQPRWVEPLLFDDLMWRRLDMLEKLGRPRPAAFRTLGEPPTAPGAGSTDAAVKPAS